MIRILFNFLLVFAFFPSYAQNFIHGKIIDADTKMPLAFVNITFNNSRLSQTSTDIDGNFSCHSSEEIHLFSCSYVGYANKIVTVNSLKSSFVVALVPSSDLLQEVMIRSRENPAVKIIEKVIRNKAANNPENIASFKYKCYTKNSYDMKSAKGDQSDSIAMRQQLKIKPLFLMESVTERKFMKPGFSEEVVIGTKVSGFQNPSFASLATDIQPFSFYQDNIRLLNIYYLNPISNGSVKKYIFRLEDTIVREKDTVFVISYHPKSHKNFDGLKGVLYINSNKYALQNVIAYPAEKGKINLSIKQQYQLINHTYWFPEQLNYSLTTAEIADKNICIVVEGASYISDIALNVALQKKDFPLESVRIADSAPRKDTLFWKAFRKHPLSADERQTYRVNDSIGKKRRYDHYLEAFEKIGQARLPFHFIDIDLSKILLVNKYEGLRLGAGFFTNEKLCSNISIGGFLGFGIKDEKWKYGESLHYKISNKNDFNAVISHQDNLRETGNGGQCFDNRQFYDFRQFISSRFDHIKQNTLAFDLRTLKYLTLKIGINQTDVTPLYTYFFDNGTEKYTNYKNTDIDVCLRFAFKEKFAKSLLSSYSLGTKYPIVYVYFSRGLKKIFNGNFNYNKIEIAVENHFYIKNLGLTTYRFEGGLVDESLPLGLLFSGEGSYDKDNPYLCKNKFQTMRPYEFLSDRYLNLFLSHDFGALLLKTRIFQPNLILHHNMGLGNLSESGNHLGISYKIKSNCFMESGLQLNNLIKINYFNLGYIGLGAAGFYRYGYYSDATSSNNFVYKLTISFTIK